MRDDFSGNISSYSKFGFNHAPIDVSKGQYPTDSFSDLYATLNLDHTFSNHFNAGIGFAFGGIVYDSTKYDRDTTGKLVNPNGMAYKYLGYYAGFWSQNKASALNTKNYYLSNLYIGYNNSFFSFKIGRFLFKNTDWLTGNQEGAEIHFKTEHTDTWGVMTHKKSSLGGKWLKDFKYINASKVPTFAAGIKLKYPHTTFIPYIQSQPNLYLMAGFRLEYINNFMLWATPITSETTLSSFYIHHTPKAQKRLSVYDNGNTPVFGSITLPSLEGYKGRLVGAGGESFLLKQIFRISSSALKHHFGFQIYENFGNANEFVGGYGNPLGIDLNDSTIYDRGTANNAIFAANAFNNIVFYGFKYQKFNMNIVNRYTASKRSDEESLSLNMDYFFADKLSLGVNFTYFDDTTKKGYQVYHTYLTHDIKEDRSYISTYIKHMF
ncbi:outer membrane family protein [Helicobacter sp. 12S02634-8]|uniref:outer membrane family protein n=1 Tax=Helicobacter sp. 12S02634-8 TaxID=1476199 RepID=UPI001556F4B6|nr:outer membrane family protein [Helicobacter sp. 12S02634-8]